VSGEEFADGICDAYRELALAVMESFPEDQAVEIIEQMIDRLKEMSI
jgi:hypothetical protein